MRGTPMIWTGTGWTGTAVKFGNYVFVGSAGGYVYAFEAMTGKLVWKLKGRGMFKGSLCAYDNKLYIGNTDNLLRCISPQTGKLIWKTFMGGIERGTRLGSNGSETSPAIADNEYYTVNYHGVMHCIDTAKGRIKWKTNTGDDTDASPVISGRFVYAAAE